MSQQGRIEREVRELSEELGLIREYKCGIGVCFCVLGGDQLHRREPTEAEVLDALQEAGVKTVVLTKPWSFRPDTPGSFREWYACNGTPAPTRLLAELRSLKEHQKYEADKAAGRLSRWPS